MELDDDLVDVVLVLAVLFIGIAGIVILLSKHIKRFLSIFSCCQKEELPLRPQRNTIRVVKKTTEPLPRLAAPVVTSPPPVTPSSAGHSQQKFVFIMPKPPSYKQEMLHQALSAQTSSTSSSYLPSQLPPPSQRRLSF